MQIRITHSLRNTEFFLRIAFFFFKYKIQVSSFIFFSTLPPSHSLFFLSYLCNNLLPRQPFAIFKAYCILLFYYIYIYFFPLSSSSFVSSNTEFNSSSSHNSPPTAPRCFPHVSFWIIFCFIFILAIITASNRAQQTAGIYVHIHMGGGEK
ncbi:hypothetical protein, unlikely [Trypanosoma brucei gambiense DAL972]|uniref:Uncharacterized protein n=1 Tax=Trypanosoma brucei gambiense (strain MHOM/CI/86/DAL972) TaxID=679716 RepID=C9ZK44_TRYB9|nr:hypothetical protein, unlikely [Trypanosoma brucei gambiense DAL972]CBH09808.1 hypothetical protein, unlikely [Trypanosoma brucei gambiense DAL972]|eukprot:XP_011772101.1 hypothetical protein, unlikely [Trypanosoma brucei gambiense DAL972]